MKIRVLIVDDHPLVREGMEAMLSSERRCEVVGTCASAEEAIAWCDANKAPDLVISDVRMPGGADGFELVKRLMARQPPVRTLLLAGMPLKAEVEKARELGAAGYVPKSMPWRELVRAVLGAAKGDAFVMEENLPPDNDGMLSPREREVLQYLNIGKTREEIGIILGISVETVKSYVKNLMTKFDCPNATAVVGRAYELGVLRP